MVDHRLDHGRRRLYRRSRDRHRGRQLCGRRLAGEESFGEVGEQPGQAEGAREATESGDPDDEDGAIAGGLLGSPLTSVVPWLCRLGVGRRPDGALFLSWRLGRGLGACFGGSYTLITLRTG